MITLNGTQTARLAAPVRGAVYLIELDFSSGTQYYTTFPLNIVASGHTYIGAGELVSVGQLNESENNDAGQLTFRLNLVDTALLGICAGPVQVYRGRGARLYVQLIDEQYQPVSTPIQRWTGYMNKVQVKRQTPKDGQSSGYIELMCVRAGLARYRNVTGLRLTHEQQLKRYPGDMGLEFLSELIERPVVWLSKAFQEQ